MANVIAVVLEIIKDLFPMLFAYQAGKKANENDKLNRENRILKEYDKINNSNINRNDAYDGLYK